MFGKKKDKKKKIPMEKFESLTANGVPVKALNFALVKDKEGIPVLQVRTPDVCEALHYEHIDFELKTTVKRVTVAATFKEAIDEKRFKLYLFDVDDCEQFFI